MVNYMWVIQLPIIIKFTSLVTSEVAVLPPLAMYWAFLFYFVKLQPYCQYLFSHHRSKFMFSGSRPQSCTIRSCTVCSHSVVVKIGTYVPASSNCLLVSTIIKLHLFFLMEQSIRRAIAARSVLHHVRKNPLCNANAPRFESFDESDHVVCLEILKEISCFLGKAPTAMGHDMREWGPKY